MTARVARLTVIAVGFDRERRREQQTRWPTLERLLARSERLDRTTRESTFHSLESWQSDVLRVLSLEPVPSAPVSAAGAGLPSESGQWLHAQFVHFAAGLNELVLVPLDGAQALSSTAQNELRSHLRDHVREASFEWLSVGDRDWLRTTADLSADTCAPQAATRLPLIEAMPRGRDGRALRRLMTELQMQLHEHAVNVERERAGQLSANGVWLWGLGTRPSKSAHALPQAYADDDFLRGLYRLHGAECAALPQDGAAALLERTARDVLVLLHCESLAALEARWLLPLERALCAGQIERLELLLDDVHVIASRWHRWRLWRRVRPLSEALE
jgi:hypothetical protein